MKRLNLQGTYCPISSKYRKAYCHIARMFEMNMTTRMAAGEERHYAYYAPTWHNDNLVPFDAVFIQTYCPTLTRFLDEGLKVQIGDMVMLHDLSIVTVDDATRFNDNPDERVYIVYSAQQFARPERPAFTGDRHPVIVDGKLRIWRANPGDMGSLEEGEPALTYDEQEWINAAIKGAL